MWGDNGQTCCPTRHRYMHPVTSSTTIIDSINVCGKSFCISCLRLYKLESSNYCPTNHPSIKDTTTSMPLVLILNSDGKTNKVPIKSKKVEETDEISYRIMKEQDCVIKKESGGFRKGVSGSTGLFYCTFSRNNKVIHFECYKVLVRIMYANEHLICQVDGEIVTTFVYGKRCYNVYKKEMTERITDTSKKKSNSVSLHWKTDELEQWLV